MDKLLFTGELPPNSINGIAYSNKINLDILKIIFNIYIVEEQVDIRYHKKLSIKKIATTIRMYFKFFKLCIFNNFKFLYLALPTSAFGILKTLPLLIIFKFCNYNSKIVLHLHRGDVSNFIIKNIINVFLIKICFRFTYKFITLSNQDKNYLMHNFPKYNYIFTSLSNTTYHYIHNEFNDISNHKLTNFIYVSNYIEEKGILDLLETFKNLDNKFNLTCYGNFTDNILKEKILSYSSKNISINGPIYDGLKFSTIREADCLILPSYNEGMPLIILESMSVGTPFISTSVGSINEMIYNAYPFIYHNKSSSSLLDMLQLFANQNLEDYFNLRRRLSNYYEDNYSLDVHQIKLKKIFSI
jgi:glycosyltransferase involved in cell wall biosynthesis